VRLRITDEDTEDEAILTLTANRNEKRKLALGKD